MTRSTLVVMAVAALLAAAGPSLGADPKTEPLKWSANDLAGASISVPKDGRVSMIAFVRPSQAQSDELLRLLPDALKDAADVQTILVVAGEQAADGARALKERIESRWPIVADAQFAASGLFNVHVWPTTVVVDAAGVQVAHIAGLPQTCAADLSAYLDFAAKKIDGAALSQRLARRDVVADNPEQAAARHLAVARKLIDARQLDEARQQIEQGLKLKPDDPPLRLALAKVMLLQNQPADALAALEKIAPAAAPPWQIGTLRARVLIALERWDEAKKILPDCLALNPDPAEAHYLSGLVYQHDADWPHAAEAFRKAYESLRAR